MELRDDDALGAIDDECAVRRHHRHIAEKYLLFANILTILKAECSIKRTGIRLAIDERLKIRLLGGLKIIAYEIKAIAAVKGRNGKNLLEDSLKTLVLTLGGRDIGLKEVAIRLRLDRYQVRRRLSHALKLAEYFAFCAHR